MDWMSQASRVPLRNRRSGRSVGPPHTTGRPPASPDEHDVATRIPRAHVRLKGGRPTARVCSRSTTTLQISSLGERALGSGREQSLTGSRQIRALDQKGKGPAPKGTGPSRARQCAGLRLLLGRDGERLFGLLHRVNGRLHLDVEVLVVREPGAGGDEPAHDDVLLEAAEVVDLAADGGLGEHLRRLLEGRRRDERLGRERRLGDAEQQRLALRRPAAALDHVLVLCLEHELLDLLVREEVRVAHVDDPDAAEHLPDDRLDVLVIDLHALEPVDLLHLVHQPAGELLLTEHAQDVVRVRGAVHERLARTDAVARVHRDVLALADQVLLREIRPELAVHLGGDDDLALALRVLPEGDDAVDLRDDRVLLRLAGLEELRDARETARDVLRLRGLARHLREHVAGVHLVPVVHDEVRALGQHVAGVRLRVRELPGLAVAVLDRDARPRVRILGGDDDLAREAGDLVDLLADGDAVDEVAVLQVAGHLGDDRHRVRVPLGEERVRLDALAVADEQLRAVDDAVPLALAPLLVRDDDLAVPVHHDEGAVLLLRDGHLVELHEARVAVLEGGLLRAPGRRAADMEGPHRELRAGLADRLGGDDAHRLADVHLAPAREIAPVALDADAAPRLAGEHRADLHLVDAGVLDELDLRLVDLLVRLHEDVRAERIVDIVERDAAEDALAHRLDDLSALDERAEGDAVHRAAIVLGDDGVLGDVDEPAGEVPGVRGLEGGVREPLPRAVRRDEVLEDVQPLAEVRGDGGLDDLAGRLGHEAAHPGELADLLGGAAGPRVGHDVDRVERGLLALLALAVPVRPDRGLDADLPHHLLGHLLRDLGPDVDDLVVPLADGDETLGVLGLDVVDLAGRALEELLLPLRDHHRLEGDRDARLGGVAVAEGADPVGEEDRLLLATEPVGEVDEALQLLLVHHLVDGLERQALRHDVVEENATDGRLDPLPIHPHPDLGLELDLALIVGGAGLLRAREDLPLPLRERALARHVVDAEDDVLRRHDDRLAVRGREDVVRAHHGGDVPLLLELVVDERLEQLERHDLREAALVELQLRAHHDDGAAGVVHPLPEQVLAEAPLLPLQHVGERLEGALVRTGDGLAAPAVVEQGVDRLLQHPLLVADDDVGGVQLLEPLQAVVAVDDAAVEVVQVRGREPSAVERHERAQVGRDHRDDLEHHPVGAVPRLDERLGDLEALRDLLPLRLARRLLHLDAELVREALHALAVLLVGGTDLAEQLEHRLAAHPGGEGLFTVLLHGLVVPVLGEELRPLQGRLLRVDDDVRLAVEDLLEILQRDVEEVADPARERLEEPDVGDRRGERDVAEPLAPHLRLDHLHAALLAHHPAVLHALVLAAVALVVLHGAEDLRAEQPVALRLERAVVDRLRLLHLAVRPLADLVRARERDADGGEGERILRLLEEIEDVLHEC